MDAHLEPAGKGAAEGDAAEHANLWEAVLKEVGSSKAAAVKKIIVLGDSNSGKSGVVTQLFQASLRPQVGNSGQDPGGAATATGLVGVLGDATAPLDSVTALSKHDLSLSYSYMDVRDEDNEEILARVGIYQLASDRAADRELLRFVLDARSVGDTAAVVVLDWSKPWRFVKSLLRWLDVLNQAVEEVCSEAGTRPSGWTAGRAAVDECRERLERFVQAYAESDDATADAGRERVAAAAADVLLPLGPGVLEANLGVPLVIVCTKADAMDQMERARGFREEDFDYIQQVLRAVCLRFGAALAYTSTHNPASFATLYHYLVHRLLQAPPQEPARTADVPTDMDMEVDTVPQSPPVSVPEQQQQQQQQQQAAPHAGYPFRGRANVVDRDTVFVPAGWDSAAKIGYLREPFDTEAVQRAWVADEQAYRDTVARAIREAAPSVQTPPTKESLLMAFGQAVPAPKQYSAADGDATGAAAAVAAAASRMATRVAVEDDQAFFEQLYYEIQDQMALEGEVADESMTDAAADVRARNLVGSSKLVSSLLRSVHTAEASLSTASDAPDAGNISDDDYTDMGGASPSSASRQQTVRASSHARSDSTDMMGGSMGRVASGRLARPLPPQPGTEGTAPGLRRKLTLPGNNTAEGAGAGAASNEELTSFFQNLLGRKGGATTSSATGSSNGKSSPQQPAASTTRPLGGSLSRAATVGAGAKDIQADLERWKAQLKRPKE
ncbi:hypothetical protein GGI07_002790 [Coemansia sp. Benny D115]|nr:hypothetical protein GGI07_002790 [Coemansia sp. Benny D115]